MVSRDRIIQLVKEKKAIYFVYGEEVEILDLMPNHLVYNDGRKDFIHLFGGNGLQIVLENLYETQAEAEWAAKMHAQRPEFFEPPAWEEFEKDPKFSFWVNKFDGLGGLYCIEKTTDTVFDEYGNEVEKQYLNIYATLIENHKIGSGYFYRRDYTKDNYIKACEYARNLFLGKENENETDSDR